MRIVSVANTWLGSNGYGFVRAFRRAGHSVLNIDPDTFVPSGWASRRLRLLRRVLTELEVRELTTAIVRACAQHDADLLFVFKGTHVSRDAVIQARAQGVVAINFYPDVSVLAHGRQLPRALPEYDLVLTTKSFGLHDMRRLLGEVKAEYMPHGYDPEVHRPVPISTADRLRYECDVSFIGTWSPKKQRAMEAIRHHFPRAHLRIWGAQWAGRSQVLESIVERRGVTGQEYAKALLCSSVNLGLLSEERAGSSSGDQITSRTFHIPAVGAFMLHEETPELRQYFRGDEVPGFSNESELLRMIGSYLGDHELRRTTALAALDRSTKSGYSLDDRARAVTQRAEELLFGRS